MKERGGKTNYPKRYAILLLGVVLMAFGIAFFIKAGLGTTPLSALPYVTSLMSGLTVGTTTILMHLIFIAAQILILRRDYDLIQLVQLPIALFFGKTIDAALYLIRGINPGSYAAQWLVCMIGTILVSIAVACEVIADVVMLAGEGIVVAISKGFHLPFPKVKVSFDVGLVVLAIVLSLIFLGSIEGAREGTIAGAILTGILSKPIIARFRNAV